MKLVERFDDGRLYIRPGRVIVENSRTKSVGFWINFSSQNWEIVITAGYIFGRLYFVFPHHFLFKNFRRLFNGKNFGEWGREIGIMIEPRYMKYSLFWYSDCNAPSHKWRARHFFSKFYGRS